MTKEPKSVQDNLRFNMQLQMMKNSTLSNDKGMQSILKGLLGPGFNNSGKTTKSTAPVKKEEYDSPVLSNISIAGDSQKNDRDADNNLEIINMVN
jgi:hypothetical protein